MYKMIGMDTNIAISVVIAIAIAIVVSIATALNKCNSSVYCYNAEY